MIAKLGIAGFVLALCATSSPSQGTKDKQQELAARLPGFADLARRAEQ